MSNLIEKKGSTTTKVTTSIDVGTTKDFHPVCFSSIRSIRSHTGAGEANYINAVTTATNNQLLAEIGYKQELKRQFSTIQVFGIAFSIMGLLPSIASVMGNGLTRSPATLVWGWFIAGGFILTVGISMAENASIIFTAVDLYY